MDRAWELMEELATKRGLHRLVWNIRHGIFSEYNLVDRKIVKNILANYKNST